MTKGWGQNLRGASQPAYCLVDEQKEEDKGE
jgi:hypothetical protein